MRPGMCQQPHLAEETIRSFGSGGTTLLRFRATQGPQHEPHSFAGRIVCKRQSDPGVDRRATSWERSLRGPPSSSPSPACGCRMSWVRRPLSDHDDAYASCPVYATSPRASGASAVRRPGGSTTGLVRIRWAVGARPAQRGAPGGSRTGCRGARLVCRDSGSRHRSCVSSSTRAAPVAASWPRAWPQRTKVTPPSVIGLPYARQRHGSMGHSSKGKLCPRQREGGVSLLRQIRRGLGSWWRSV
jgi:hypothetical protein